MRKYSIGGFKSLNKLSLFIVPLLVIIGVSVPAIAGRCTAPVRSVTTRPVVPLSFEISYEKDGNLDQNTTNTKVLGVNGTVKETIKTEYKCKEQISSEILNRSVIKQPVNEVLLLGTRHTTTESETMPYSTTQVIDNSLSVGQQRIQTAGTPGSKDVTYTVSQDEGQPEQKIKTSEVVTLEPINEVVGVGPQCDPNYSGCVPNVYPSDVDCYYGSGNGPYYTHGPVRVLGVDRYGLDRDNSGWGCESG